MLFILCLYLLPGWYWERDRRRWIENLVRVFSLWSSPSSFLQMSDFLKVSLIILEGKKLHVVRLNQCHCLLYSCFYFLFPLHSLDVLVLSLHADFMTVILPSWSGQEQ